MRQVFQTRRVPGFPDYVVSDDGYVWAPKRQGAAGGWLKPYFDKYGYPRVVLRVDGKSRTRVIPHLVAEAYIGPRPEGMHVCHDNGKPWDNRSTNLRYDTPAGNAADRHKHGTRLHGETGNLAKLTNAEAQEIREAFAKGLRTQAMLSAVYGISKRTIRRLLNGETYND